MNEFVRDPVTRPERSGHGPPKPRLEERPQERVNFELGAGDFQLYFADGETVLIAIAPTSADRQVIRKEGTPAGWTKKEWKNFLGEAEKFERPDLQDDLEDLRCELMERRVSREEPVFNDDGGETPSVVHTLEAHYSRDEGYIKVRGTATYEHREKLRSLGLRWNPSSREWVAEYSAETLSPVVRLVKENGRAYNPDEIGYEKCPGCGRWYSGPSRHSCVR